ncbi:MAG: hypothetical protein V3U79_04245 [Dehalococcoidia bacterium]
MLRVGANPRRLIDIPELHSEGLFRNAVEYKPVSRPGDFVELRAEMDCLVALTVCPFHGPFNGWVITPLRVQVQE